MAPIDQRPVLAQCSKAMKGLSESLAPHCQIEALLLKQGGFVCGVWTRISQLISLTLRVELRGNDFKGETTDHADRCRSCLIQIYLM
ncbi:MAG: hypothetical protein EBY21_10465 [Alphaproteobacteria bacterium]|nr:hypothetical protein [Alphaproteobacteria bacterium]